DAILAHPRIKLKEQHVRPVAVDKLLVYAPDDSRQALLFSMEALLLALPKVIVTGIPSVERAVISKEKAKGGKAEHYMLLVEGTDLRRVMATAGVRGAATTTNHVHEIERYLGIEAARLAIMQEIQYTMSSHG
ncbi:DNA-directed RNA polymerase subunit, partial [Haematococcus lacustris]